MTNGEPADDHHFDAFDELTFTSEVIRDAQGMQALAETDEGIALWDRFIDAKEQQLDELLVRGLCDVIDSAQEVNKAHDDLIQGSTQGMVAAAHRAIEEYLAKDVELDDDGYAPPSSYTQETTDTLDDGMDLDIGL